MARVRAAYPVLPALGTTEAKKREVFISTVAEECMVALSSLKLRLAGKVAMDSRAGPTPLLDRTQGFPLEQKLVQYIMEIADRGFGLAWLDIEELAVEMANDILGEYHFDATQGMPPSPPPPRPSNRYFSSLPCIMRPRPPRRPHCPLPARPLVKA
jgi:hypothetical protein